MKLFIFLAVSPARFALIALLAAGCAKVPVGISTLSSGSTGALPSPVTVSQAAPLGLQITTTYDTTQDVVYQTFQETGTTICQTSTGTPVVNCTVAVPEGRLYFSSMSFSFTWLDTSCKLLTYAPYYYQGSSGAAFFPPWNLGSATPIVCNVSPLPVGCYSGAASGLGIPGFPIANALIFFPNATAPGDVQFKSLPLPSAYSNNRSSNRWTVNDATAGQRAAANAFPGQGGDAYVANTYRDYVFTCRDDWFDPVLYRINLFVRDIDSAAGNPVMDDFTTWKEF